MKKIKEIYIITLLLIIIGITTSLATSGTVNTDGIRLRNKPSTEGLVITLVSKGAKVDIEEKTGDWYKVKYKNDEGYISAQYVDSDGTVTDAANNAANNNTTTEAYPQAATTTVITKMYVIPSITSSVMEQIDVGKTITINEKLNNWAYITYDNKSGWIRNAALQGTAGDNTAETTPPATTPETTPAATTPSITKGYVNVSSAYVRDAPSTSGKVVTSLLLNTGVTITGEQSGWYAVQFQDYKGYMSKDLVSSSPVTTSRSSEEPRTASTTPVTQPVAAAPAESPAPAASSSSTSSSGVVDTAMKYLGYKYVYGGNSPSGFDCSGFTQYVFKCCGYSLNRSASAQSSNGTPVSRADLQPGDIVLFDNGSRGSIGHVGIYIGGGNMIHAANPSKGVVITTINSGYYNTYYYGARRIM